MNTLNPTFVKPHAGSLKDIAATFNLYTWDDIPGTHAEAKARLEPPKETEVFKTLKSYDSIEVDEFFQCKKETSSSTGEIYYFIERFHTDTLIKGKDSEYILRLANSHSSKGKYYLYPYFDYLHQFKMTGRQMHDTYKHLKEPNRIGVFTEKKVNDWIQYCDAQMAALHAAQSTNNTENDKIKEKIETFIKSCPGCQVQRWNKGNNVDVKTDKFRVKFTHEIEYAYLSTKIEFFGTIEDVLRLVNK